MTRTMNWQFVPHATLIRVGNHRFKNCYEIGHDLFYSTLALHIIARVFGRRLPTQLPIISGISISPTGPLMMMRAIEESRDPRGDPLI